MESGWFMLIVLAVMGGLIAYLGDKIGSKVGKRKIKLMGLRPKYTSILVTIMTGISIAVVTLGVMSVLSENARVALFGMNKLRQQQHVLEEQRDRLLAEADKLAKEMQEKNDLLADNELKLASQEEQLDGANDRLRLTLLDLEQVQAARDDASAQLGIVQTAFNQERPSETKNAAPQFALAGFSFGGYVATFAAQERTPDWLLLMGAAVHHYTDRPEPSAVPDVAKTLVIHGAEDEVVALDKVLAWAGPQDLPVVVLAGSSHFFHGKLIALRNTILRFAPAISG